MAQATHAVRVILKLKSALDRPFLFKRPYRARASEWVSEGAQSMREPEISSSTPWLVLVRYLAPGSALHLVRQFIPPVPFGRCNLTWRIERYLQHALTSGSRRTSAATSAINDSLEVLLDVRFPSNTFSNLPLHPSRRHMAHFTRPLGRVQGTSISMSIRHPANSHLISISISFSIAYSALKSVLLDASPRRSICFELAVF